MLICERSSKWYVAVLFSILIILAASQMVAEEDSQAEAPSSEPAEVRGTTTPPEITTGVVEDDAGEFPVAATLRRGEIGLPVLESTMEDSDWVLIDSDTFDLYIPAGKAGIIRFDGYGDSLQIIPPPDSLTALAMQAIGYAPDWLALELTDAFARLATDVQDLFAGLILGSVDPYVDEIAFVVAHTAPNVLRKPTFYTGMITENAEDVYAHDPFLDYVDIVDYGSAAMGGDYYSTVLYRTAESGDTVEIELDRDRYYWDIVHPKITDEFPTYIDPATGAAAAPPTGRFWREFLFTHADSGYAVLKDELAGCEILWAGKVDDRNDNGAIGIITQYMLDTMVFGSGVERPIQPVRIYRKHLGRCGEWADITCAASRSALIPCNSPGAFASDHTWNEFYDQRWVHWEPVNNYIDSPMHYEGWGKEFIGIFNWRGDDDVWTVTERYTPHCTLTVSVTDSAGYPVDGAQVSIARKISTVTYYVATWNSTDHTGQVQFLLGDNNDIFARIESALGTVPAGPLHKRAVTASMPDSHYTWERIVPTLRPNLPASPAVPPPGEADQYRLRVDWQVEEQFIYGQNRLVDNTFSRRVPGGAIAFFVCDQANYTAYASSDSFLAYEFVRDTGSADVAFTLPTYEPYYAVLSNEEHVINAQVVRGVVELYRREQGSVAGGEAGRRRVSLAQNTPNPFGSETRLAFSLATETAMDLSVYDVAGRRVATLLSGTMAAGDHNLAWNGTDSNGRRVAPGVYVYRLDTPEASVSRKMVRLE